MTEQINSGITENIKIKEQPFPFKLEVFDSSVTPWKEVKNEIIALENGIFGEEAFDLETLKAGFTDPDNTIVIARNENAQAVGYTWATPARKLYKEESDYDVFQGREATDETAYIYNTGLLPEYQGKGYVSGLYKGLEEALLKRTDRKYNRLHRDAAVENGLADKILKNNQGRIISYEEHDSPYGRQMFIDMWIDPPTQNQ